MTQTNPPLWKATITLAKALAPNVAAVFELAPPTPQAVLIHEEPFKPDATVEALYTEPPDAALLSRLVGHNVEAAPLPDQDWIRLSQEGLPPVRAGRFFVYGAHDAGVVPPGVIPIKIEAGLAFGTGHHETTALCLAAMSDLARRRRFMRVLDLGCGTGLLAIGAAKLWRRPVVASDIDPVAVEVTLENARANGAAPLVRALTAEGLTNPTISARAPYDLIVANILASPLTQLAPSIVRALAKGGMLVLSGLLTWQENMVVSFYTPHGLILRKRHRDGPWTALVLEKPGA
ncbi:MAG TPA: 50S ribosomal protein L11 methyltransferase [Rhizomicrobium sp.]|jgi:ribosomal protein L11 methyltransferase|nr:50S ribosomal protein L11 methyltransferase [Rhizomicrobium sp.]